MPIERVVMLELVRKGFSSSAHLTITISTALAEARGDRVSTDDWGTGAVDKAVKAYDPNGKLTPGTGMLKYQLSRTLGGDLRDAISWSLADWRVARTGRESEE
ncbi:MAG: hypothetical protein ACRDO7_13615 [Nocardioidaceae bacterium]